MGQPYTKPFRSVTEQVALLAEHGLEIGTPEYATSLLQRVGYYRLSGYWHLFREFESPSADASNAPLRDDDMARPERRKSTFIDGSR